MPLVPELYVADVSQSLHFYCDILGFACEYQRSEEGFALVSVKDCRLMLEQYHQTTPSTTEEFKQGRWRTGSLEYPLGRGINLEFSLSTIMPIYTNLKANRYPFTVDMYEKSYRVRNSIVTVQQFLVMDNDGYLLRFAEDVY